MQLFHPKNISTTSYGYFYEKKTVILSNSIAVNYSPKSNVVNFFGKKTNIKLTWKKYVSNYAQIN